MQNQEEDKLKRFLQDTFSDYEPEPAEQTWEHIRTALQPEKPSSGGGFRNGLIAMVGLCLLTIGTIVLYKNSDAKTAIITKVKSNKTQAITYQKTLLKRNHQTPKTLTVNRYTPSEVEGNLPTAAKQLEVLENNRLSQKNMDNQAIAKNEDNLLVSLNDTYIAEKPSYSKAVFHFTSNNETQNNNTSNWYKLSRKTKNPVQMPDDKSVEIFTTKKEAETIPTIAQRSLERIRYKNYSPLKSDFALPTITQVSQNREAKPIKRPIYLSLSIEPLQTYRILTVSNRDVQNLQKNSLFDAERSGFSLGLGIVKPLSNNWNLRATVSYLSMRQWAVYQVATDKILVKNTASPQNSIGGVSPYEDTIEKIGETQTENKTLGMAGLKLDVQKFLKTSARNRYFISTGMQVMYEPAEHRTNTFINASAGFQHLVNKDLFLTIEPTASYLLNNINDSQSLIQTNAYNVGLKIGLSFRVR
ncbi:MAG: hypothetical protein MUF58_03435 [Arcicella sp.]|jgi:hypothetical protein|nr:hypothetical protein [Arcicella sp.]